MNLKEFIEQFEAKMEVKDEHLYYNAFDSSTNIVFALEDNVTVSIGVFDDEPDSAVYCIHIDEVLIMNGSMALDKLIECFGKV